MMKLPGSTTSWAHGQTRTKTEHKHAWSVTDSPRCCSWTWPHKSNPDYHSCHPEVLDMFSVHASLGLLCVTTVLRQSKQWGCLKWGCGNGIQNYSIMGPRQTTSEYRHTHSCWISDWQPAACCRAPEAIWNHALWNSRHTCLKKHIFFKSQNSWHNKCLHEGRLPTAKQNTP